MNEAWFWAETRTPLPLGSAEQNLQMQSLLRSCQPNSAADKKRLCPHSQVHGATTAQFILARLYGACSTSWDEAAIGVRSSHSWSPRARAKQAAGAHCKSLVCHFHWRSAGQSKAVGQAHIKQGVKEALPTHTVMGIFAKQEFKLSTEP